MSGEWLSQDISRRVTTLVRQASDESGRPREAIQSSTKVRALARDNAVSAARMSRNQPKLFKASAQAGEGGVNEKGDLPCAATVFPAKA